MEPRVSFHEEDPRATSRQGLKSETTDVSSSVTVSTSASSTEPSQETTLHQVSKATQQKAVKEGLHAHPPLQVPSTSRRGDKPRGQEARCQVARVGGPK